MAVLEKRVEDTAFRCTSQREEIALAPRQNSIIILRRLAASFTLQQKDASRTDLKAYSFSLGVGPATVLISAFAYLIEVE